MVLTYKTLIPFIQGCFVSSFVEIDPSVIEKKIFIISLLSPLWKKVGIFLKKLNFLHKRMLCARIFSQIGPLISSMWFCFLIIISSLWKESGPSFKNFKFSSPKDALCQNLVRSGSSLLYFCYFEKEVAANLKIFKSCLLDFTVSQLSILRKGRVPSF